MTRVLATYSSCLPFNNPCESSRCNSLKSGNDSASISAFEIHLTHSLKEARTQPSGGYRSTDLRVYRSRSTRQLLPRPSPAMGVHSPASSNIPAPPVTTPSAKGPNEPPRRSVRAAWLSKTSPITTRSNRRPAPGPPRANDENNRRKNVLIPERNFAIPLHHIPIRD